MFCVGVVVRFLVGILGLELFECTVDGVDAMSLRTEGKESLILSVDGEDGWRR